jgi:hypothetical protein
MKSEPHARPSPRRHPSAEPCFRKHDAAPEAAGSGSKTDIPAAAAQQELTEREELQLLLKQFQELREYVSYYAAARIDSAKASVRDATTWMALAALGVVAVAGLIVMASWLVLSGIAQGAGTLFGAHAWIGALITGVLALAGIVLGISCAVTTRKNAARKRTARNYETRNARQRARFGRDVHDREPAPVVEHE